MDKKILENMKKIILLILMYCIQFCIYAQDIDSLIDIKGYYVTIFSKNEIVFSYEQKIKKEMGLSFETPIDYKQLSYFIPVQVGNKIVCEKEVVADKILSSMQNDSIYYVIPHWHYNDILKKMDIINRDVSREMCIFAESMNHLSPYYEVRDNNNYLFKCIYIEGYAIHKYNQEFDKKRRDYLWSIFQGNKYIENREFFFIVKINNYTPYIKAPKVKKWLPYID